LFLVIFLFAISCSCAIAHDAIPEFAKICGIQVGYDLMDTVERRMGHGWPYMSGRPDGGRRWLSTRANCDIKMVGAWDYEGTGKTHAENRVRFSFRRLGAVLCEEVFKECESGNDRLGLLLALARSGWLATIPARYTPLTLVLASFAPGFTPKISQASFGLATARVNIRAHALCGAKLLAPHRPRQKTLQF